MHTAHTLRPQIYVPMQLSQLVLRPTLCLHSYAIAVSTLSLTVYQLGTRISVKHELSLDLAFYRELNRGQQYHFKIA
jgi:hypothetical protein